METLNNISRFHCEGLSSLLQKAAVFSVENLGSEAQDHRLLLRQTLKHSLLQAGFNKPTNFLNLQERPSYPGLHLSLSHTTSASAFAWIQEPHKIGVDIETTERLSLDVVKRVSSNQDITLSPDPLLLWPAKEAVFKALSPSIKVLSDVSIFEWTPINQTTWSFFARMQNSDKTIDGEGLVCSKLKHILSFFVCQH